MTTRQRSHAASLAASSNRASTTCSASSGFPVVPIAMAAQKEGITYIGMRNEQAASYAAQAAAYLTGRPQACLVVSRPRRDPRARRARQRPGELLADGAASAGPTALDHDGMGAFQEERQVLAATPFTKYSHVDRPRRADPLLRRAGGPHARVRPPGAGLSRPARRRHPRPGRRGRRALGGHDRHRRRAARRPTPTSRPRSPRCAPRSVRW